MSHDDREDYIMPENTPTPPDSEKPSLAKWALPAAACGGLFVVLLIVGLIAGPAGDETADYGKTTTTATNEVPATTEAPTTTTTAAPTTTTTEDPGPRLGDPNVANSDEADGTCDQSRWLSDPDCGMDDHPGGSSSTAVFILEGFLCTEGAQAGVDPGIVQAACDGDPMIGELYDLSCDILAEVPAGADPEEFVPLAIQLAVSNGDVTPEEGLEVARIVGAVNGLGMC